MMSRFSMDSTVEELLEDKEARAVLEKYLGNLIYHPAVGMFKKKRLSEIINMAKGRVSDEQINTIKDELMRI